MKNYKHRLIDPASDLFVAGAIDNLCFGRLNALNASLLEVELSQSGTVALVALMPNCGTGASAIGGYVMYRSHQKMKGEAAWLEIVRIAVDPEKQRQGMGRFLVGKVVRHLKPSRPELVTCVPDSFMPGAHQFFSKCGFKPAGVLRRRDGEQDYTRMILPLETEVVV